MSKRGRPPLPPELRCNGVRVVFHANQATLDEMREYAEFHGTTIQKITRLWWRHMLTRAKQDHKIDFRGAAKNN